MPRKRGGRSNTSRAGTPTRGGAGTTVLAFLLGAGLACGAGYLYLRSTPHPTSPPSPTTAQPTPPARERPPAPASPSTQEPARVAPFGTSEDVFEAGAHLYSAHCASCHGTPDREVAGQPPAQQIWRKARHNTAAQTPSTLYGEISAGAPSKGMPSYAHTLTDTQIWQLALLLKNADQDLPDPVVNILKTSPAP